MTITPIQIVPAQYVTNPLSTFYISTNIKTRIDKATFTNNDTVAHTVSVYLVPNGASANASNLIVNQRSLSARTTYHAPELIGHILGPGDSIQASVDTNTTVAFAAAGVTISP